MGLKTILQKTGAAGTVGLNTNALPNADGDDAKSLILYQGLHLQETYDFTFTRTAQDGNLVMEVSMDGTTFRRTAFRRMDTDTAVSPGPLVLGASASFEIQLAQPNQNHRIVAVRFAFWLAVSGNAGDSVTIKGWEGR